jgi:hypothetical protein
MQYSADLTTREALHRRGYDDTRKKRGRCYSSPRSSAFAIKSPGANLFERALQVARQQQAKSWELRAERGMAPLARSGQAAAGYAL